MKQTLIFESQGWTWEFDYEDNAEYWRSPDEYICRYTGVPPDRVVIVSKAVYRERRKIIENTFVRKVYKK
jgi:hypothetical protein